MNESIIAVRYTKALFSISKEKNTIDSVKADMEFIFSFMQESKDLEYFFKNPVLKPTRKIEIIRQLFIGFHSNTLSFIELLIKNRREEYLHEISRNFLEKVRVYNGIETAVFTTAIKIDTQTLEKVNAILSKALKGKVELSDNVDDRIIGGFILQVGDKQYDASVKTALNNIKRKLSQTVIN